MPTPKQRPSLSARRRAPLAWLRLVWGGSTALLALLSVLRAPTFLLWQTAVGITEWGHLLAVTALLPLLPGWRRSRTGTVGGALGIVAAVLALTPLLRAVPVANRLPEQLAKAFAAPPIATAPLSLVNLVRGVPVAEDVPETLVYATTDGQALQLDLYQPVAATPAPLVVVIHGGSWRSGDRRQLAPLNSYLADRGYAVATVSYRLAPAAPFPAARDDIRAAIAYLQANAAALNIDGERIVLLGRSAGGQLALLAGYTADTPAIRGVVAFYAPSDMRYGYENPANPLVLDSREVLEGYLSGSPTTAPDRYTAASPLAFVDATTPPTLLFHGGRDELVSPVQSERLDDRLAEAGAPHLLVRLPWATHGCDYNFSGPCGQISTYAIERFLTVVTK